MEEEMWSEGCKKRKKEGGARRNWGGELDLF